MLNRRDFLKQSIAASGAFGLAQAARAATGEKPRIRCGMIGTDHPHALDVLDQILQSQDYELAGVCEPDSALRESKKGLPILKDVTWRSQDELLSDPSVQLIVVESGLQRLLPFGRAAVDAGKHLHLDKPAGTSLTDWKALLDVAAEKNLLVQMGYMYRYNPGFDLIREAVQGGWLGDVFSIQASMCTSLSSDKRKDKDIHPGGIMLELGCHLIDMICIILGEPAKVTAFLRHDSAFDDTLADNTLAVLEYDKAMAVVETSAQEPDAFPNRRFKIAGSKGKIVMEPIEPPHAKLYLSEPAGGREKGWHDIPLPDLPRHARDFADLAACLRGEAQFAYSKEHDYVVQRTLLRACGQSA
ncbi:MAG: Gfo/Idh/MocA family oxidoreductase [Candidatus Hydrogenedentes bacterium]|nr:Gfo/Idh/MocA family oxidoreductase [Candidatus Hydrogenedentota bacterium]